MTVTGTTQDFTTTTDTQANIMDNDLGASKDVFLNKFNQDIEVNGNEEFPAAKYPNYLPTWDPDQSYPPLEAFPFADRGQGVDTTYPDLFGYGVEVSEISPKTGSEIQGLQLTSLSDSGRNQLARFVAERKVVVFREQQFADLPISDVLDFGAYYGRYHVHPTSGSPKGYPQIHLVHLWHSDVTYERQPPGITFLYVLEKPESGGDTLFANCFEAYERLSPAFQHRLHGLTAIHSGAEQIKASIAKGSVTRRAPVVTEHPIVRTHPTTGEKAIFVNPQFTRNIVGMKQEESEALLKFLYNHVSYGADFQVRVRWEPGTVVVWDNRVTQHSAIVDWTSKARRHLARLTLQAEKPYETPFSATSN
ncbi:hypothetical protein PFICI_03998 [Pestalotiopsis fici W106-1]|uniref:TauD/TfdA-like domain-containing protein n=1 Tax=Pestalotiopsis fici (strain W106-1 / CGMCC3.15140) TaxID=1229662 RepID=W3XIS6_PESFW|nr:uncharacterized protein PFICI_03998 [Pestalotiopsis fici W106-1]ETS85973.1 hypothetical protein PFICI_03998 [Pestalotiopsis fici W106-1]